MIALRVRDAHGLLIPSRIATEGCTATSRMRRSFSRPRAEPVIGLKLVEGAHRLAGNHFHVHMTRTIGGEGERKTPMLALPLLGERIGGEAHPLVLSAVRIECGAYLMVNSCSVLKWTH